MFWFIILLTICTIGALCLKSKDKGTREGGIVAICAVMAFYLKSKILMSYEN